MATHLVSTLNAPPIQSCSLPSPPSPTHLLPCTIGRGLPAPVFIPTASFLAPVAKPSSWDAQLSTSQSKPPLQKMNPSWGTQTDASFFGCCSSPPPRPAAQQAVTETPSLPILDFLEGTSVTQSNSPFIMQAHILQPAGF